MRDRTRRGSQPHGSRRHRSDSDFGYVFPLAAIGPLATFVALHLVGTRITRTEFYHASVGEASAAAVVSFAYAMVGVPLLAVVIRLLAPLFAARSGFSDAMRVTAYAYTPAWLAGILLAYPPVRSLQLAAVAYALYLLAFGLQVVMFVPWPRAIAYAGVALACAAASAFGVGALAGILGGLGPVSGR